MKKIITLILSLFTILFLFSCSVKKVDIMTSSFFNYDIVKSLIKNTPLTQAILIEPGRATEHSIGDSLTSKKIYQLKNSQIFIYTSQSIDSKILQNKNNLPKELFNIFKAIFPQNLDPMPHHHNSDNHNEKDDKERHALIHYWTSIENVIKATGKVSSKLKELFPDHAKTITNNELEHTEKLNNIKNNFTNYLKNKVRKKIIYLSHDAIGAFTNEFNLDYHPFSITLDDNKGESSKEINKLITLLKDENIKTIFLPELNTSEKLFQLIKKELPDLIGLELSAIHNISSQQFEQGLTYQDILNNNISNIKKYIK